MAALADATTGTRVVPLAVPDLLVPAMSQLCPSLTSCLPSAAPGLDPVTAAAAIAD